MREKRYPSGLVPKLRGKAHGSGRLAADSTSWRSDLRPGHVDNLAAQKASASRSGNGLLSSDANRPLPRRGGPDLQRLLAVLAAVGIKIFDFFYKITFVSQSFVCAP